MAGGFVGITGEPTNIETGPSTVGQATAAIAGSVSAQVVVVPQECRLPVGTAGQQVSEDAASDVGQVASSTDRALQTGREHRMLVAAGWTAAGASGRNVARYPPGLAGRGVMAVVVAR